MKVQPADRSPSSGKSTKQAAEKARSQAAATKSTPKVKAKATVASAVLRLHWDLHELPSSQHRAGLAGLALCVKYLERTNPKVICKLEALDGNGLTLAVDRAGMQGLFDDVYHAKLQDTESKSKWAGAEPKRVVEVPVKDEKTGKTRTEKRFVYERVFPAAEIVADWDTASSGAPKLWQKLWQDLVWSTLRGVPATREPFNARAEKRKIDDGGEAWDELASEPDGTVDLSSTYALGVQDQSAENVPFEDIARFRFLLHFWSFVVAIYVPAVLQRDGKRDFVGHAVAMPDVAVLDEFVAEWDQVARARGCEASGYVPREAVVDLAAEAGLDVVRRCNDVMVGKQGALATASYLSAVDVFHVEKVGNNVRMRGVARIVPEYEIVNEYARVRNASYWSPIFRRQRISNVIERKPWWWGFARLCSTTPDDMTIRHQGFQHDCKAALTEVEMKQDVPEDQQTLEHLIYRRIQSYVVGKLDRKYDLSWSKVKGNPAEEKRYGELREKVAREAFLAVRSRSGADFVAYFTSTICSVPQRVAEDKYLEIARALMDLERAEHVRSLTLLALSAVA